MREFLILQDDQFEDAHPERFSEEAMLGANAEDEELCDWIRAAKPGERWAGGPNGLTVICTEVATRCQRESAVHAIGCHAIGFVNLRTQYGRRTVCNDCVGCMPDVHVVGEITIDRDEDGRRFGGWRMTLQLWGAKVEEVLIGDRRNALRHLTLRRLCIASISRRGADGHAIAWHVRRLRNRRTPMAVDCDRLMKALAEHRRQRAADGRIERHDHVSPARPEPTWRRVERAVAFVLRGAVYAVCAVGILAAAWCFLWLAFFVLDVLAHLVGG